MTQTNVGALIEHLAQLYSGGTVAGIPVQVIDGPGAADIRNNVLFLGHSLSNPGYAVSSSQDWATMGKPGPTRKEILDLNCSLRVGIGNRDMAGCRERALQIFDSLISVLRTDANAFTANGQFQYMAMTRYRMYQEFTSDGVSVIIEFVIGATARV